MDKISVILSKKFSLIGRDYIRGLGMACLTAALVVIQSFIENGNLSFDWKQIGMAAVGGGVGYLIKNGFFEPTKVITVVPDKANLPDAETVQTGINNILP